MGESCSFPVRSDMDNLVLVRVDQLPTEPQNTEQDLVPISRDQEGVKAGPELQLKKLSDYKTVSKGLMDIALLTANCAQSRQVLDHCSDWRWVVTGLLIFSLLLQFVCVCLLYLERLSNRRRDFSCALQYNVSIGGLVSLIIITNIAISAFGTVRDECGPVSNNTMVKV